jgi:hypothetical protein
MARRGGAAVAIGLIAALGLASCGGGSDTRYSDQQIIDRLNLRDDDAASSAYLLGHDAFCAVEKKLLNDSDEVESAADSKRSLVITSREGNVGVVGVPVFPRDCKDVVVKKLNKLDPVPKEG